MKPLNDTATIDGAAFRLEWTKYRREPCEAVRSREIRLGKGENGQLRWEAAETEDDALRKLVDTVKTGQFRSLAEIGTALQWSKTAVHRRKVEALERGLIKASTWDMCLRSVFPGDEDADF